MLCRLFRREVPQESFFRTAKFEGQADFRGVTFCEESDFSECSFGDDTDFTGATFAKSAKFIHASFGAGTQFDNSEFRSTCHFKECKFGYHPSFFRAKFGRHAIFSDSEFGSACTFNGAEFGKIAQFTRITMLGDCDFASENKENTPASARAFYTIDFDGHFFLETPISHHGSSDRERILARHLSGKMRNPNQAQNPPSLIGTLYSLGSRPFISANSTKIRALMEPNFGRRPALKQLARIERSSSRWNSLRRRAKSRSFSASK